MSDLLIYRVIRLVNSGQRVVLFVNTHLSDGEFDRNHVVTVARNHINERVNGRFPGISTARC